MKDKLEQFRQYMIYSLAVGMIMILWIFCIDALFYGTWPYLRFIGAIAAFAFILCLIEHLIKTYLEEYFILSILIEFGMIVVLFFIFSHQFNWCPPGKGYLFFFYAIPIYTASYFLRLLGIRQDAESINKHLAARKRHFNK